MFVKSRDCVVKIKLSIIRRYLACFNSSQRCIDGGKFTKTVENIVGNGQISPFPIAFSKYLFGRHVKKRLVWERLKHLFAKALLIPSFNSTGQSPASYCHGIVSVVRPSVHKLFLQKNFVETIYWIFTKFHRNVP